jgi:hypothetical protein
MSLDPLICLAMSPLIDSVSVDSVVPTPLSVNVSDRGDTYDCLLKRAADERRLCEMHL